MRIDYGEGVTLEINISERKTELASVKGRPFLVEKMGQGRNWTEKEKDYLQEKWGTISLPAIAKKLNRSENAILIKVQRMGLGAFLENGEYITWNQFQRAININSSSGYKNISWIQNRGFPIKHKKVGANTFKVVYIDDFWKWAEENKSFLDFSRVEEFVFGIEPDWVKEKRRIDHINAKKIKVTPWTIDEDELLKSLLRRNKFGYAELSKRLNRSAGAIRRRIVDLGIKERPLRADNHNPWTQEELEQLKEFILQGYGYEAMSELLESGVTRSAKAIRGYIGRKYKTEVLDKVRRMLKEEEECT